MSGQPAEWAECEANMKKAKAILAALCLLLIFFPFKCSALPENIRPVSAQDHFSHRTEDRFYTENWRYHAILDTGEFLSISFILTNVGLISGSAGVQLTLSGPHCNPVIMGDEFRLSYFEENRQTGTISIGPHSMILKGNLTRLIFSKNGIKVDLTIRQRIEGFQIGDGVTVINGSRAEFKRTFLEIPRGDLEGVLTVRGAARSVTGAIYMDHDASNVLPTSYSTNWYSLRAFFPDYTIALQGFQYLPKAGNGRWAIGYVTDRNKVLGVSTDFRIDKRGVHKSKGCSVPTDFEISMSAGDMKLNGTFTSEELYCCAGVFDDFNWLVRKVGSSLIGNPIIFRFRSHADLFLTTPDRTLHLEGPAYSGIVSVGD
jgi:predicted secreted hydrolase